LLACLGKRDETSTFQEPESTTEGKSFGGRVADTTYIKGDCTKVDGGPNSWSCPPRLQCIDLAAFGVVGTTCSSGICPVCAKDRIGDVLVCDIAFYRPNRLMNVPETYLCMPAD